MTNKQLAEKAAKWLGFEWHEHVWFYGSFGWLDESLEDTFFSNEETAPILMHLGQVKLDKNNNLTYECGSIRVDGKLMKTCSIYQNIPDDEFRQIDSNKFIAFWKAVEATGVLDANK